MREKIITKLGSKVALASVPWPVPIPVLLNVPVPFPFSIFLENISMPGKPVSFDCLVYLNVLTPKVMTVMVSAHSNTGKSTMARSRDLLRDPLSSSEFIALSLISHPCHSGSSALSATAFV